MNDNVKINQDNNIIYIARLHWIIFIPPIILFILSLSLMVYITDAYFAGAFGILLSVLWMFSVWITYEYASLTIKDKQIILRTGFLMRQITDIPITKIASIDIRQSIMGSMLRYGALIVTGTGGTRQYINFLNNPLICRRHIEDLLHNT